MKTTSLLMAIVLVIAFSIFAIASTEDEGTVSQSGGVTPSSNDASAASTSSASGANDEELGDYSVVIDSIRFAETFDDKKAVIVKYVFTNNKAENASSFMATFDDNVYQNGVGLNPAFILKDSAKYSADNQTKEIKKGASIEVEVAYELNDTTTNIEVEVKELWSFSNKTLTKTFSITE